MAVGEEDEQLAYQLFRASLRTPAPYGYGPADASNLSPTPTKLDLIRQQEFSRLNGQDASPQSRESGYGQHASSPQQQSTTYLDHAGSSLYSERQLEHVFEELRSVLLSNPHR